MILEQKLTDILGVPEDVLNDFEETINSLTGKSGVLKKVQEENLNTIEKTLLSISLEPDKTAEEARGLLRKIISDEEEELIKYLENVSGENNFEKAVFLSKEIVKPEKGYFLKKSFIEDIFRAHKPENLLNYLDYSSVDELIEKEEDLVAAFSALRFVESNEWMHKTFELAYGNFSVDDFEERSVEVKVLGSRWEEIAKKFVAKKHHNVSHLKEFGIIFLNPIAENVPGKFLRDFALLLHYFHEVSFYSKIFKKYSREDNFNERFKALLRGDVKDATELERGEWLIVQRYLFKEDPKDPRLFMPRINPESLHWARGERDLSKIKEISGGKVDLSIWYNLDWIGGIFKNAKGEKDIVSFDLEDNVMSLVSFMEGKQETFNYHQREAIWNKIFTEYLGGEAEIERLLIENFDKGTIKLS